MSTEIQIRAYQANDKAAVLALLDLNVPKYFAPEERADLIDYLDNKIEKYFVADHEGRIVGAGGVNFLENGELGVISWDMVDPSYQGKGIGGSLLKHRLEVLKTTDGVKKIRVRTSQLAYQFYQKFGFVLVDRKKDYWAEGLDLYQMVFEG